VSSPALAAGCDVVDVARLSAAIDRRDGLLERVFTDIEVADARRGGTAPGSPTERARLAARFAAKEAARKALGDLRLPFHATEVRTASDGAPHLYLHGRPSGLSCSLSHDGGIAMAVVVGCRPDTTPAAAPPTSSTPATS
jgi:holo-[acyl-carrier protein] synthase